VARALTVLLVLLVVVLGLAALVGYLAYGTGPGFEGEAQVSGLAAPVTIGYTDSDVPMIEAQSEADLMTGLGYAHALRSAWPMALLRQAATSSLSGWIEDSTANLLDRHTLRLGFGAFARATYDALSEEERAVLQAYARGVNGAFGRARLNEGDEFVLFDVRADPWQPWHALAVERLVAYLATPPVTTDSTARAALRASASLREFAATDSIFRNTLHLGDLGHALAFTLRDSTGSTFAQRLVYGQTALPLFREVVLRQGGRSSLVASIPGTLMLPAGYGDRAWSVFLSNTATLAPDPDSTAPAPSFARIVTRSGDESLVKTYRRDRALLLYDPEAPPPALRQRRAPQDTSALGADSLRAPVPQRWQLRWQGLGTGTDLGAWRALLRGGTPSFTLMRGTGLLVEGGQARVLGSPAVVRDLPGGVFAGDHPLSVYVADRLALPADSAAFAEAGLLTDAYSTWAAELAPPLTAILGAPDEVADDLREVAAYLRGWDFRYAPSSIAASIFDTWMAAYQRETGTLPDLTIVTAPPPPPDSTGTVPERPVITALEATLRQALDTLRTQHGEIGAAWRWQNVQEATRHYPLFGERASDGSRFASAIRPDGGHPTALAWGPSPAFSGPEATASWSARASAPDWDSVRVRHRDLYDVRYRTRRLIDPVEPYAIARTDTPEPRLRLVPAGD
jgi:acyl-homoserine lactone acylase PvdQ